MPAHDFKDIGDVLNFQLLKGIITAIDSATDTCTVAVGGDTLAALLYYHCEPSSELRDNGAISGAAKGFSEGDEVIVLINKEKTSIKVIGHTDGIRRCEEGGEGSYYIFYIDGAIKVANCSWESGLSVIDTKASWQISLTRDEDDLVKFFIKRFTHTVPTDGVIIARDLYFIATSLYINPNPFLGWVNFATANPTFPLVTNNGNTKITMTTQVLTDLNAVNALVNNSYSYIPDPAGNDNWGFLEDTPGGDCENFALEKAKILLDMGYPASALHVETGKMSLGGHAWLVVQTTTGDYALDTSSDIAKKNSSLLAPLGENYYSRRRQIGSNWASISPFAWVDGAVNTSYNYFYILDPLLNVIYPLSSTGLPIPSSPLVMASDGLQEACSSVNFNASSIYVQDYVLSGGANAIQAFKLSENVLTFLSLSECAYDSRVLRDGSPTALAYDSVGVIGSIINVAYHWESWGEYINDIASKDGYFDYQILEGHSVADSIISAEDPLSGPAFVSASYSNVYPTGYYYTSSSGPWPSGYTSITTEHYITPFIGPIIGKSFGHSMVWEGSFPPGLLSLSTPFNETFSQDYYGFGSSLYYQPDFWSFIDTDSLLIQSFIMKKLEDYEEEEEVYSILYRIYKDGESVLSNITTVVGTTESNLLGLAYIPSTDRLN